MALHKAHAQFERAKWRLRLLIPSWALQLALSVVMMGLFAWRLGDTLKNFDELKKRGALPTMEFVWETTNVVLSFVASVCTLFEIGRFMAESLTPWTMLFTHVIKLTCAAAILALDIVVYVKENDRHYSLIGLGLDVAFIITAVVLGLYTTIIYRRLSAIDDYAHPANVKPYGFNDGLEPSTSYTGSNGTGRLSIDKTSGWHQSPRRSSSSNREENMPMQPVDRSPSVYSHQRDTSFDDYVVRRGSLHSLRSESDRQTALMAAGLGPYSPSMDGKLDIPTVMVTDLTHGRSRSLSLGQSPIYRSDHVLVAVPEEEDETIEMDRKRDTSREALLGSQEVDMSYKMRPAPSHGQSRSVSYDSRLNAGSEHRPSVNYRPRDSLDNPPVLQEVDVTDIKWASSRGFLK